MRNDDGKALSRQAYYEATEPVRMLVFVRQRECQITDYDSRSTWDRLLDAGSTPASSTRTALRGSSPRCRVKFKRLITDLVCRLASVVLMGLYWFRQRIDMDKNYRGKRSLSAEQSAKPSKESNCRKRQPIPEGRKRLKDGVV